MANTKTAKRAVVKLGTGVLTKGVGQLDTARMDSICGQIAKLKAAGMQVIMVSSGAVGLGMGRLGIGARPKKLSALQTCAAVGQGILIQTWAEFFKTRGIVVAQILLTRDDVDVLNRHRALKDLLDELLERDIVPVINENDCVSAAELNIKFGDNDVLSALVATLAKADALVILSTAPGLIDMGGTEKVIEVVEDIDAVRSKAMGTTSATAVGGMITKLKAADIATSSGCAVYIASGAREGVLQDVLGGKSVGTYFVPAPEPSSSKKRWFAYFGKTGGQIYIDAGAEGALRNKGSSLLAAGVKNIKGSFAKGALVEILPDGETHVIARGLAHVSSDDLREMVELHSKSGGKTGDIAVHRDNLAMV